MICKVLIFVLNIFDIIIFRLSLFSRDIFLNFLSLKQLIFSLRNIYILIVTKIMFANF